MHDETFWDDGAQLIESSRRNGWIPKKSHNEFQANGFAGLRKPFGVLLSLGAIIE